MHAGTNPLTVALVATVGATIGEMTAYIAGMLGRQMLLRGYSRQYAQAEGWMNRHGALAVFLFALIPMLVYDLIGIFAGSTRYHVGKFMAATFAGRFLRCLLEAYLGYSLLHMLPLARTTCLSASRASKGRRSGQKGGVPVTECP